MALIAPGPTYSPDGTTIVYQARDDRTGRLGELYVEVSGKERTQITHLDLAYSPTAVFAMAPRFTADGQTVLFMLPSGGVWSVPVTGGEPTLVIAHGMWPVPLPDGKTVAYLSAPVIQSDGRHIFGHSDVWVVRLDNPGSARLVGTVPFDNSTWGGVSVSSDGTKLVYGEIEIDIASGHSTSP